MGLVALMVGGGAASSALAAVPVTPSTSGGIIGSQKNADAPRECEGDEVLVGARGQNRVGATGPGGILVQLDLLCGSVDIGADGKPAVTPNAEWLSFPAFNEGRGNTTEGLCPVNQVAYQLSGSTFTSQATQWTQSAILSCRPLVVTTDGELKVDGTAQKTLVTAGDSRANPTGQRIEGPFCESGDGELNSSIVRGYRPQLGGEGLDGYAPSCATFAVDHGDAPESYGAASHPANAGTFLGALVDGERMSAFSADARGDDAPAGDRPNVAVDDEDGVATLPTVEAIEGGGYSVDVATTNRVLSVPATLTAWIDFDRNGTFEPSEAASAVVPPGASGTSTRLTWTGLEKRIAASGTSFARIRLAVGNDAAGPAGPQRAGEVEDYSVELVAAEPTLDLEKTVEKVTDVSKDGVTNTSDVLTYAFVVTNPSSVSVTGVTVTDPLPGLGALTATDWPSGSAGVLRPGQSVTFRADYTVTQADTDRGSVVNTASASALSPLNQAVDAPDSTTTTPLDRTASLTLTKKGVLAAGDAEAGDRVDYTFAVTNTGSLTVAQTAIVDPKPGLSTLEYDAWPGTPGSLAPGESVTASATYELTQADIDARSVDNTATVSGVSGAGPVPTVESTVSVPIPSRSEIAIEKTAVFEGGDTPKPGDRIAYEFEISNVGATTAKDVTVRDELPRLSTLTFEQYPSGTDGVLAPGQSVRATASYVLTQEDIDTGTVDNTASAGARTLDGSPIPEVLDAANVDLNNLAVLTIEKRAAFAGGSHAVPGESVEYSFTVTNEGNVTLTDVQVDDRLPRLSLITFGTWPGEAGQLAPGETVTASANYAVTDADIREQGVSNTASATASARSGPVVSEPSVAIVPLSPEPKIILAATGAAPMVAGLVVLGLLVLGSILWVAARRRQAKR
ncbi:hypothetical protein ALI44B_02960 [Leifsonia sp. ALI-44-B]|uniref:DUF7507 domain-containing protein n=1 Tax=Leifsonia sp. ALI-44-B TaxID=1933776 RepID=UPI00097BFFF1|nr:GEVED domain-containing protein [Leifsonia sp. ALI-44-B]ONI63657.1 hypothetical protein ALI44B_02960 [Leifsonia sp. ALI-44-B]